MKNIIDNLKKMPFTIGLIIILAAVLVVMVGFIVPAYNNTDLLGKNTGNIAGKAVGSYEGITKGYKEGLEAGKEAGLSAEDTTAEIVNEFSSLGSGKLQVLSVNTRLGNFHTISDDYAALYVTRCKATYSVDLSTTQIQQDGEKLIIIFPEPTVEITNESDPEKIFEAQKFFFSGSSEDGAKALVNSMNEVRSVSENELANSEDLKNQAIDSARKQIEDIARAATMNKLTPIVKCETE